MPAAATVWGIRGTDAVIVQDSLHGHKGDIEAKVDEIIGNALVAPRRILHWMPHFRSERLAKMAETPKFWLPLKILPPSGGVKIS